MEIFGAIVGFVLCVGTAGGWAFIIWRLADAYRRGTS